MQRFQLERALQVVHTASYMPDTRHAYMQHHMTHLCPHAAVLAVRRALHLVQLQEVSLHAWQSPLAPLFSSCSGLVWKGSSFQGLALHLVQPHAVATAAGEVNILQPRIRRQRLVPCILQQTPAVRCSTSLRSAHIPDFCAILCSMPTPDVCLPACLPLSIFVSSASHSQAHVLNRCMDCLDRTCLYLPLVIVRRCIMETWECNGQPI